MASSMFWVLLLSTLYLVVTTPCAGWRTSTYWIDDSCRSDVGSKNYVHNRAVSRLIELGLRLPIELR